MLPPSGGRIVLLPAAFWAHVLPNGHFGRISSTLYLTVLRSLGGHASARRVSHKPCFRQVHCFVQGPLRFLPVLPNLIPTKLPGIIPGFLGGFYLCVFSPSIRNDQRVLHGGMDPWGVESANLGRPIFAPHFPQTPLKQAFSLKLQAKMGRPDFADPTPRGSNPPFKAL